MIGYDNDVMIMLIDVMSQLTTYTLYHYVIFRFCCIHLFSEK